MSYPLPSIIALVVLATAGGGPASAVTLDDPAGKVESTPNTDPAGKAVSTPYAMPMGRVASTPRAEMDMLRALPLAFYIAKGPANSCGDGCDTWIAAEGGFDLASAERFRRFVKTLHGRKLPIFFNSPGGVVNNAMNIGGQMRALKLTAAVGKTVPRECSTAKLSDKACHDLKLTGREVAADLAESKGLCASACVYAFIGASTRNVVPGALLGIHAGLPIAVYSDGRVGYGSSAGSRSMKARLRTYIAGMGIDPALLDAAESISHERLHILTREEVVRFRIDTREAAETAWNLNVPATGRAFLAKTVMHAAAAGRTTYPQRILAISCTPLPTNLALTYVWPPSTGRLENMGMIQVGMGSSPVWLPPNLTRPLGSNRARTSSLGAERFREAAALDSIFVHEGDGPDRPMFNFSTAGLPDALAELTKRCGAK